MINQVAGSYINVPRELSLLFKENPGAQRAFIAFLNSIAEKLYGSNSTLSDIEQRSNAPSLARFHEVDKQISDMQGAVRVAKARLHEIEKELKRIEMTTRSKTNIGELIKRLDDMDATTRPRG